LLFTIRLDRVFESNKANHPENKNQGIGFMGREDAKKFLIYQN